METYSLLGEKQANRKWIVIAGGIGVAVLITSIALAIAFGVKASKNSDDDSDACPPSDFPIDYSPYYASNQFSSSSSNQPSKSTSTKKASTSTVYLLKNATIWTVNSNFQVLDNSDIILENGKISKIGQNLQQAGAVVIDATGKYITPGLVDMHSHLGVYSFPEDSTGTSDGNEMTNPTFPQLRAIDALNPSDPAIPEIRSGGVTTALVLPGSGNIMGGEGAYVKLKGQTVSNMLISGAPRALKMACGENPKRVYGGQGVTPMSRLGVGWMIRNKFFEAAQLLQAQQKWKCDSKNGLTNEPMPQDIALEPLVSLLTSNVYLNVHCYKVEDMEMMIRTSHEFNFRIAAFHHGLEAWMIPELLVENNISVATFSDNWGFKMEAYNGRTQGPIILHNNGVNVALKSDHPVIFAKYLLHEAQKSYSYGLPEQAAFAAVTRNPANAIGLGSRIGSLEVGKDADVVIWDGYPLDIGVQAEKIFIDGTLFDNNTLTAVPKVPAQQVSLSKSGPNQCQPSNSYAITQVGSIYTMNATNGVASGSVVVQNGLVTCVGSCTIPGDATVYSLNNGGVVLPGLVSSAAQLGQVEVDQEDNTYDGSLSGTDNSMVFAADGLRVRNYYNRHLDMGWRAGVNTIVTSPTGSAVVSGVGVAFYSYGATLDDSLIDDYTSLHVHIGNEAKQGGLTNSVSGQIASLRSLFKSNKGQDNPIGAALNGSIPVVCHVDEVDEIVSILRLKREFGFNLVILGGAEAHAVASTLSNENVAVILNPRVPPHTFETWESVENSAVILSNAGVKVAMGIQDIGNVRNLRWEAGFAVQEGMDYMTALSTITKFPAQIFGLEGVVGSIQVGQKANFVGYSGDPLTVESHVEFVALGTQVQCQPQQY